MATVKATLMLDEFLLQLVKQRFEGKISEGVNTVLEEHLIKEKRKGMFGVFKGEGLRKELIKMRKEDAKKQEEELNELTSH